MFHELHQRLRGADDLDQNWAANIARNSNYKVSADHV